MNHGTPQERAHYAAATDVHKTLVAVINQVRSADMREYAHGLEAVLRHATRESNLELRRQEQAKRSQPSTPPKCSKCKGVAWVGRTKSGVYLCNRCMGDLV